MDIKVGCDVVEICRIRNALISNENFIRVCFTKTEQEQCSSKPYPPQHFAARFAGKEAIIKALSGFDLNLGYDKIEITNEKNGRPKVTYLTEKKEFQYLKTDISLSHSETSAIAFVILHKERDV